jgi:hypothetical protein
MPVSFPTRENQPELPEDWDEPHVEELIEGAIDTHAHPFPSPFPRRMGIVELARDCAAAKYRAVIAKSHHHSMVPEILALENEGGLADIPVKVFGGTPTNNSVGGLNPYAVDLCLNMGGRWVWFPTLSSPAHVKHVHEEQQHGRPGFVVATITLRPDVPISILDENGKVKPEVIDICELIAQHDVVLCGGHLPANEFNVLIDEAQRVGVQRIICSHPPFVVGASVEMTGEWARKGVYIEHAVTMYGTPYPGRKEGRFGFDLLQQYIAAAGPSQTVMVSDTGQQGNERPVNAMRGVIRQLINAGYNDDDIKMMTGGAAAQLLLKASDGIPF